LVESGTKVISTCAFRHSPLNPGSIRDHCTSGKNSLELLKLSSIKSQIHSILYNNYSETRNLIGQGSGYPARGIKMPSRDFRGILKMSLFHCSYFIKQLPNGFRAG
jgi:hypothetical protein